MSKVSVVGTLVTQDGKAAEVEAVLTRMMDAARDSGNARLTRYRALADNRAAMNTKSALYHTYTGPARAIASARAAAITDGPRVNPN